MRWCVQNLSTFNDGRNYRPVSMILYLTETIMCLIEKTGDSTHERAGRGELGAATPLPSPSLPKFWATQIFGQLQKFWQNQFLQKFPCFVSSFFLSKQYFFFILSLSRRSNSVKFIFGLCVLRVNLNNTYSLCRYLQGRQSMSSAVVESPT